MTVNKLGLPLPRIRTELTERRPLLGMTERRRLRRSSRAAPKRVMLHVSLGMQNGGDARQGLKLLPITNRDG